jgi:hypothetical protein
MLSKTIRDLGSGFGISSEVIRAWGNDKSG